MDLPRNITIKVQSALPPLALVSTEKITPESIPKEIHIVEIQKVIFSVLIMLKFYSVKIMVLDSKKKAPSY